MGIARNTVRTALRTQDPPSRERDSLADGIEPQFGNYCLSYPRMPATVIAE
ncbi:hypothetical protein [Rhodococcus erythropolis]|uniref:hypothetical protein n=1 Tax=Rhodococcus erythropolis TaxID=1833 RepID=UPI0036707E3B